MYNNKQIDLHITIDTVYGFINKYAYKTETKIIYKHQLETYLEQVFNMVKSGIIEDFEKLEQANKIEVNQ